MAKIDFDDLMKTLKVEVILAGSTIISIEVDFELPRGFIAKIHEVVLEIRNWNNVFATTDVGSVGCALIRDPDDITSIQIPLNEVQHDVIADMEWEMAWFVGGPNDFSFNERRQIKFSPDMDVITARNMRFNANHIISTNFDDAAPTCTIYYTLEKVTDADILDLLEIL